VHRVPRVGGPSARFLSHNFTPRGRRGKQSGRLHEPGGQGPLPSRVPCGANRSAAYQVSACTLAEIALPLVAGDGYKPAGFRVCSAINEQKRDLLCHRTHAAVGGALVIS